MIVGRHYNLKDLSSFFEATRNAVTWKERLVILSGVVRGLVYLHKNGLAHGNLHSGNVLVEKMEDLIDARIADFGLNRRFDRETFTTKPRGVLPFLAPEVLASAQHVETAAADMYAYGIIMWQVATGERPFRNRPYDLTLAYDVCMANLRPDVNDEIPICYVEQMRQCWDVDPGRRPPATDLDQCMETSYREYDSTANPFVCAQNRRAQTWHSDDRRYTSQVFNFPLLYM
jgi:serine/threonine protein kinase